MFQILIICNKMYDSKSLHIFLWSKEVNLLGDIILPSLRMAPLKLPCPVGGCDYQTIEFPIKIKQFQWRLVWVQSYLGSMVAKVCSFSLYNLIVVVCFWHIYPWRQNHNVDIWRPLWDALVLCVCRISTKSWKHVHIHHTKTC